MKHIEILNRLNAWEDAVEWAKTQPDLETAWNNCHRCDWMLWLDGEMNLFNDKQRRLMACRFVRETPIGDKKTVWDLLDNDERSRNAVIVAERYANGEATQSELSTARSTAGDAARYAARSTAGDAARSTARYAQAEIIRSFGNPFKGNEVTL